MTGSQPGWRPDREQFEMGSKRSYLLEPKHPSSFRPCLPVSSLVMFEPAFRKIDDILRKEAGCTIELAFTDQSSWLLFLKLLHEIKYLEMAAFVSIQKDLLEFLQLLPASSNPPNRG